MFTLLWLLYFEVFTYFNDQFFVDFSMAGYRTYFLFSGGSQKPYGSRLRAIIRSRLTQDAGSHLFSSSRDRSKIFLYNFKSFKFFLKELPVRI